MQKLVDTIAFKRANGSLAVMAGATATIYDAGTANLSDLFEDDETTPKANPLIADANGLVQCKIPNGEYDIAYSNGGSVELITGVVYSDVTSGGAAGQEVVGEIATVVTCSTAIPADDTIPQSGEGTQVVTAAITPTSAGSVIEISYFLSGSATQTLSATAAVFQDLIASALAGSVSFVQSLGNDNKLMMSWKFKVSAGSTSARTYKLRVGGDVGTIYVNGDASGNRLMGGDLKATIHLREIP